LLPDQCGTCHPQQLADWRGSRHRQAMGPGVLAQLLDDPEGLDVCNRCHAPLLEQRPTHGGDAFRPDLRSAGLACASCHVRDGVVHGPPAREGRAAPDEHFPHGGYQEHDAFEDASFCGSCHQFDDGGRRVAGVLLEDTVAEWLASPWGRRGESCQSCHMPDRRHLWRGIHDPAFTEQALGFELEQTGRTSARYAVTSERVGHRFPTYVTPRVSLVIQALDAAGEVVAQNATVVQRRVDLALSTQAFDTRLHPGESAVVELEWRRRDRPATVRARLLVEPDEFYRRFFEVYRAQSPSSAALIQQARQDAVDSVYVVGVRELEVRRR